MTLKSSRKASCHRHPGEPITGFCAPCLTERLSGLDLNKSTSSLSPELRRSKSFTGKKPDDDLLLKFEPRRKSCVGFSENVGTVFEDGEEEEEEEEEVEEEEGDEVFEDAVEENGEFKTMKEYIDLEWGNCKRQTKKDFKDIAGNIRNAASVFGKKLMAWRRKPKARKHSSDCDGGGGGITSNVDAIGGEKVCRNRSRDAEMGSGEYGGNVIAIGVEKVKGDHKGDIQMEIGESGMFRRRSCDTDPRFSFEGLGPRMSFEKARASCDGYFLTNALPGHRPMICVMEDDACIRSKDKINNRRNDVEMSPGGSIQTRDYYSDPFSRRRKSFDRSSTNKKASGSEVDEMKSVMNNLKASPAKVELFHGAKVLITENDLRNFRFSLKDDDLKGFDCAATIASGADTKGFNKFGRWQKAWTMRGSMHKRSGSNRGFA